MSETTRRVLQRFILPLDKDRDVLPLYVDPEAAILDADKHEVGASRAAKNINRANLRQSISSGQSLHPDQIAGRHTLQLEPEQHLSMGTYFNAFPASYWRRWTVVKEVRLTLTVSGAGAAVTVFKSMANGRSQKVESGGVQGDGPTTLTFDLDLKPFQDGGWYWFDVTAGDAEAVIEGAEWSAEVPADRAESGTVTIGITTMNRPDFCAELLGQIGTDPDVLAILDEVLVMEQGTQKVVDSTSFPDAQAALGDKLRIIEQGNIGGSGGFARAQFESLQADRSTYVLFLDDDIVSEPESILRAVAFGDLARRPSIVGGHMFSLYARSRMHSFGEIINRFRFWWMSPPTVEIDWDFGARNIRSSRWVHRRIDVDFNPWFFCLIPLQVVREIGLGLPLFIKWDDSEYGVRAQAAGFPTISMPGCAVWHVPWTDKNDALDWQAYFHLRNRFVAALLHSPFPHGGRLVRESFNHQLKHLLAMQYSVAEMRLRALEDVLAGPEQLHATIGTKLGEIRELRKAFDDAQLQSDPEAFPPVRREKPRKRDLDTEVEGRAKMLIGAVKGTVRQFLPVRPLSREFPESAFAAMDAGFTRLAKVDSAVVSMPDGTSAAFYKRQPEQFKELLKRSLAIHQRLHREWDQQAERYRAALPEITSMETWEATFKASTEES